MSRSPRRPAKKLSRQSRVPVRRPRLELLEDRTLLDGTPIQVPEQLLVPLQSVLLQPTVDLNLLSPEIRAFFTSDGALRSLQLPATRVIYLGNRSGYSPAM